VIVPAWLGYRCRRCGAEPGAACVGVSVSHLAREPREGYRVDPDAVTLAALADVIVRGNG
jgi:hypothetical protein